MNVVERTQRLQDLLARIEDVELREALTSLLERSGELPTKLELLVQLFGETLGTFFHYHAKTLLTLCANLQQPNIELDQASSVPTLLRNNIFSVRPMPERDPDDPQRMPMMVDFVDDLPTFRGNDEPHLHDVDLSDGSTVQFRTMTEGDYERLAGEAVMSGLREHNGDSDDS
jgi:hypothetical protein